MSTSMRGFAPSARRALASIHSHAAAPSSSASGIYRNASRTVASSGKQRQWQGQGGQRSGMHTLPAVSSLRPSRQTSTSSMASSSSRPAVMRAGQPRLQHRQQTRSIFIQTQDTPNQDALKFLPSGQRVLPEGFGAPFVEYLSARATVAAPHPSALAAQLLAVDGITAVFYGPDYITVTKAADVPWPHVKPEVFALITEAVTAGQPLVTTKRAAAASADGGSEEAAEQQAPADSLAYDPADEEVVQMIKELLETRIRPAIQEDGGDIEYRGFSDGNVMLKLRGACRTCDSSTVTLKNGIENMLMHYIEEVKSVTQVLDEEEEIALKEFEKFEAKLRQAKGDAAVAGTGGKGTLDAVEG